MADPARRRLKFLEFLLWSLSGIAVILAVQKSYDAFRASLVIRPEPIPGIEEVAVPVKLVIPSIDLSADISPIGQTKDGFMEIPSSAWKVGWYELGVAPGEAGNAVLAGHLDTILSTPGVFWKLDRLKEGDEIEITDAAGTTRTFIVQGMNTYQFTKAPLEEIFGPSDKALLRLVTCTGDWLTDEGTYSERFVLLAEEKE